LHGEEFAKQERRITSHHFIGPHPMTLQREHIAPSAAATTMESTKTIHEYYSVTDKADGERKLLFVSPQNGKMYMLDTTMNVVYTGQTVKNEKQWNSLLDGEHIKKTRHGKSINKYKAFDLYYWAGKSTRELAFYEPYASDVEKGDQYESRLRLPLLQKWVLSHSTAATAATATATAATAIKATDFAVEVKTFLTTYDMNIFEACKEIWESIQNPAYEYETDGLIFTPTRPGVGSDQVGHAGPLHKNTWKLALKWKPPQFNTVDFLVRIKHDSAISNDVHVAYLPGQDLTRPSSLQKYKTLTLCCGFNPRDHGYLNPQKLMLEDDPPNPASDLEYLPCAFEPTDPPDPMAHICEWTALDHGNGEYVLMTEDGEYFDEDMIVEFRYNRDESNPRRRWIPLRVRYDKTNELRMGYKNYGNAYHVAESNWRSIWYEVTAAMITTGQAIPTMVQDDVANVKYYNRVGGVATETTLGLRQFHNHYVKRRMIQGVAHEGDQLLDLGVGKAGDLRKWMDAKVAFVWGIDLSHDNIENRKDGACARYVGLWKTYGSSSASSSSASPSSASPWSASPLPKAIFQQGNVEMSLRGGHAFSNVRDKAIAKALFGQGPKDKTELGMGVYNQYGAAERGFHVTSCQFAIHYFFKDAKTLHSFLRNVADCTREQGYFLCTSFDGNRVFDRLRRMSEGMSIQKTPHGKSVFEIIKRYSHNEFADDETSLGYAIDVYQDTINTWNQEYLVNFVYLKRMMENYGFVLVDSAEAQAMGFVSGSGLFQELHDQLLERAAESESLAKDMYRACHMTELEREISFLNRYCIFKKVRSVDTKYEPNDEPPVAAAVEKDVKLTSKKSQSKFRALGSSSSVRVELG
jgi:hypothetical protein